MESALIRLISGAHDRQVLAIVEWQWWCEIVKWMTSAEHWKHVSQTRGASSVPHCALLPVYSSGVGLHALSFEARHEAGWKGL